MGRRARASMTAVSGQTGCALKGWSMASAVIGTGYPTAATSQVVARVSDGVELSNGRRSGVASRHDRAAERRQSENQRVQAHSHTWLESANLRQREEYAWHEGIPGRRVVADGQRLALYAKDHLLMCDEAG